MSYLTLTDRRDVPQNLYFSSSRKARHRTPPVTTYLGICTNSSTKFSNPFSNSLWLQHDPNYPRQFRSSFCTYTAGTSQFSSRSHTLSLTNELRGYHSRFPRSSNYNNDIKAQNVVNDAAKPLNKSSRLPVAELSAKLI